MRRAYLSHLGSLFATGQLFKDGKSELRCCSRTFAKDEIIHTFHQGSRIFGPVKILVETRIAGSLLSSEQATLAINHRSCTDGSQRLACRGKIHNQPVKLLRCVKISSSWKPSRQDNHLNIGSRDFIYHCVCHYLNSMRTFHYFV